MYRLTVPENLLATAEWAVGQLMAAGKEAFWTEPLDLNLANFCSCISVNILAKKCLVTNKLSQNYGVNFIFYLCLSIILWTFIVQVVACMVGSTNIVVSHHCPVLG